MWAWLCYAQCRPTTHYHLAIFARVQSLLQEMAPGIDAYLPEFFFGKQCSDLRRAEPAFAGEGVDGRSLV